MKNFYFLLFCSVSLPVFSAPNVLGVYGQLVPIEKVIPESVLKVNQKPIEVDLPCMIPGEPKVIYKDVNQSFFIIGEDYASLKWLRSNAEYLSKRNITGFLVNVSSPEMIDTIFEVYPNIILSDSSSLRELIGYETYPCIVEKGS